MLLLIYCRYLHIVSPNQIHPATSNVDVLKAIAGINSTVRIIADTTSDLNDHLSRRPDLLAPCCPVTPFSAYHCLRILGNFEHIIPDGDTRFHDIYSSLHFFAKRWSIAGWYRSRQGQWLLYVLTWECVEQLFQKIEIFLVEKDTGTGFSDPDFYNR